MECESSFIFVFCRYHLSTAAFRYHAQLTLLSPYALSMCEWWPCRGNCHQTNSVSARRCFDVPLKESHTRHRRTTWRKMHRMSFNWGKIHRHCQATYIMWTVAPQPLRQSLSKPASKHCETVSKSSSGSMSAESGEKNSLLWLTSMFEKPTQKICLCVWT